MKLIDAIINNPQESRKEDLLKVLEEAGKKSNSNFKFLFREHVNHAMMLETTKMCNQRLNL